MRQARASFEQAKPLPALRRRVVLKECGREGSVNFVVHATPQHYGVSNRRSQKNKLRDSD